MTDAELEKVLNFKTRSNQQCRVLGNKIKIDIFRGSKILKSQRKVAELSVPRSKAEQLLNADKFAWYRHVQELDFDLGISYSRFD